MRHRCVERGGARNAMPGMMFEYLDELDDIDEPTAVELTSSV